MKIINCGFIDERKPVLFFRFRSYEPGKDKIDTVGI
jgi:hypothetical protein